MKGDLLVKLLHRASALMVAVVFLAGCANEDGTMGRPGSPAWMGSATNEQKAKHFGAVCASYGFKPNTPTFAQCIAEETRAAEQGRRQAMAAVAANPVFTPRRSVSCTTTGFGNMATTNCY